MPRKIGRAEFVTGGLIKITAAPDGPPLIGFFYDGADLYAYNYLGGVIGSLIAQKPLVVSGAIQPGSVVILTFSPIRLVFRDAARVVYEWNLGTNTITSSAPLSDSPSSFVYAGGGIAHFFIETAVNTSYAYYSIGVGCVITQLNIGNEDLAVPLVGVPSNSCYYDGSDSFFPVIGSSGNSGFVRLFPGSNPVLVPSDDAFAGDPTSDWINAIVGHHLTDWAEAIYINDQVGCIAAAWTGPGFELIVSPFSRAGSIGQMHPDGSGTYISMYDFSANQVAKFLVAAAAESSITWYDVDDGPGGQPFLMIIP